MDFFQNYENIGKNRLCLHGEQYPYRYTDQYIKLVGFDSWLEVILISFLYLKHNPDLKNILFGKVVITLKSRFKDIEKYSELETAVSLKQLKILKNFILNDLNTLSCNFPSTSELKNMSDKYLYYKKAIKNPQHFEEPLFNQFFKDFI